MLPKANRIKKRKDFELLYKRAKTFKSKFIILKAAKSNSEKVSAGFVVSQKVSKKATVRNKIRRRLSAIMQAGLPEIKPGTSLLFIVLSGAEKATFADLAADMKNLLKNV